jgi:hypothetical protein
MSVPTFPDATAQEKFMLMLLERVDAVTDELRDVKKELADTRTQLALPLPSVTIESRHTHCWRWVMGVYTSSDTPLAAVVLARRVLKILPRGSVHLLSRGVVRPGCDLTEAYVNPGVCVNLAGILNAIHEAIYADHAPPSDRQSNINVSCIDRITVANCMMFEFIKKQKETSGLDHGTCYRMSAVTGDVQEEASNIVLSPNDRYCQNESLEFIAPWSVAATAVNPTE